MTETETETPYVDETWIFGGSRVNGKGKKSHAWIAVDDVKRVELWFPARGSHSVGGEYRVQVRRTGTTVMRTPGTERYIGRHDDPELCTRLELAHRAAGNELRLKALERNDARKSELDTALEPLVALMRRSTAMERDTLLTYVMRKMVRA